jgi:Ca-activated chloride channel family protein
MAADADAPMRRRHIVLLALLVAATEITAGQQPIFRAAVDVVRIDASVMNGIKPVPGLTAGNFVITDNGVPQTVDSVSLDTVPLNLTLLLDTSGSLAGDRLTKLIDAANGLVKSLRPEDTASLVTFSEPVRLAVTATKDRAPLIDGLKGLTADGATSLNDALFLAFQLRPASADESRSVLLVFSDGRDTSSWLSGKHALEAAKRSGLIVHVIELVQDQGAGVFGAVRGIPSEFLGRLADAGGGRRWYAKSAGDLRELFGRALNELRARYLLTYSPNGVSREGWHDVKVTLKGARGEVTARPGYFAASQ